MVLVPQFGIRPDPLRSRRCCVRQMARTRQVGLLISDASEEVKEMLRDTEVARMIREIDSSPHPHRALLDARSDPRVIRLISQNELGEQA